VGRQTQHLIDELCSGAVKLGASPCRSRQAPAKTGEAVNEIITWPHDPRVSNGGASAVPKNSWGLGGPKICLEQRAREVYAT